jgi:hypothetical protein
VVGTGTLADSACVLGLQDDVRIPLSCEQLALSNVSRGPSAISAEVIPVRGKVLRIVCSQEGANGRPWRVSGGAPPSGLAVGKLLQLSVEQDGHPLEIARPYDRAIWSGLSWTVADVAAGDLIPGRPVRISYAVDDPKTKAGKISLSAFAVGN